ncbi:MAG: hypothetical protein ACLUD0_01405 [Eubacterium ramulus]
MASGNDAGRECKCSGRMVGKTKACGNVGPHRPGFIFLNDNNGGIMSLCGRGLCVNYCHQQGIEVWGLVSNLENQDVDDTSVFSLTSSREIISVNSGGRRQ